MKEIRIHGRGDQGAVTMAKLLSDPHKLEIKIIEYTLLLLVIIGCIKLIYDAIFSII